MSDERKVKEFDLRYISLGAGVQSTTMYLMAIEGELGPMPDFAVFADTQSEPAHVMRQVEWIEKNFGDIIPIEVATVGSLREEIRGGEGFLPVPFYVARDGRPSVGRRQCTREFKLEAIKKKVREKLGLKKGQRAAGRFWVECWIGISVDEATRAKPSWDSSWVENRFPLLYDKPMRRWDCLNWYSERNYPMPGRSACTFCPYQGHSEWVAMKQNDPESFADACRVDDEIGQDQFVHRSLRPLREVVGDPSYEDQNLDLFQNECEGMCGV